MGEAAGAYRLGELGWLQFQQLCELLLEREAGLGSLPWHGDADYERWAVTPDPLELPWLGVHRSAPILLVVAWMPADVPEYAHARELARRMDRALTRAGPQAEGELVLLTNVAREKAEAARGLRGMSRGKRTFVLGGADIGRSLDERPGLRAAMPSVLGVRDLAPLIDEDAARRSSLDVERARALARVFVPTRAYARARTVLAEHRFVVLTGPPEMGKTAIAQMLALAAMTEGWEAHECIAPEDVWRALARDRRQVFVADDAFGSTEYRPDAAERWARELSRLLQALDERHWLIWTSRPAPLRAGLRRLQRERGAERFPAPGEVLVDAGHLDAAEKTLILFRHAKGRQPTGLLRDLVRAAGVAIVEHEHFTPERIRRLVTNRLDELTAEEQGRIRRPVTNPLDELTAEEPGDAFMTAVERELATPTAAMTTSFRALGDEHRAVLVALLDAPAGLVDERELTAIVRRHHPGGLSRPPAELVDRLRDHFLHVGPMGIGWVHPSWRDLVIEELRGDDEARRRFLGACGPHGALFVLSHGGGAAGERALPLIAGDADWDCFGDRLHELVRELPDREVARLLLAAADALALDLEPHHRVEAGSLAGSVAGAVQRRWDRRHRPIGVFALEAWFALASRLPTPVEPPEVGVTWVEMHPGACEPGEDRSLLARADDWLALAQTLAEHAPETLARLGFPERERTTLERLLATAWRAAADPELREPADRVVARIAQLAPELRPGARKVRRGVRLAERALKDRWWAPHDLRAPPSDEPAARRTSFTAAEIRRVLRDL